MPRNKTTPLELTEVPFGSPRYGIALDIRKEVFVREQQVPREEEIDAYEAHSVHYLLCQDHQGIGTGRWRRTDKGIKIERMAMLRPYRNQGLGQHLLAGMLASIATHTQGETPYIYLYAQQVAESFYTRAGFCPYGSVFYDCDIPHIAMYKP